MDGPIPVELLPVVPEPWLIVVRRSEQVLYLYQQGVLIRSYPVSTGKADTITPLGWWKVVDKAAIGEPGVFGTRWMRFDRYNRAKGVYEWYPQSAPFGIHGTNEPDKIGTPVSAGCIRLRNPQVEELYDLVPIGTHVLVID
jgi:lipoprotein-anchoring transpeptidase ErfK/SrfK